MLSIGDCFCRLKTMLFLFQDCTLLHAYMNKAWTVYAKLFVVHYTHIEGYVVALYCCEYYNIFEYTRDYVVDNLSKYRRK